MRGFATGPTADAALVQVCSPGQSTATIERNEPFAGFVSALSLPAFAMQSPTALEEFQDDAADNPTTTEYSTAQPTGTGPVHHRPWDRGNQVEPTRQRRRLG